MSDTSEHITSQLKALRKQGSFTQLSLAQKAGINDNYYSRVERGEVSPTIEKLEKIVKALGVKSSEILPF